MSNLARDSLRVHLRNLRGCGFCRLPVTSPPIYRRFHEFYRYIILAVIILFMTQETICAYLVRNDLDTLSRVLFLFLCHVTTIAKQVYFHTRAREIDDLIYSLDDPLFNQENEVFTQLLTRTSVSAGRLANVFSGMAVATCTLWAVLPTIDFILQKDVQFFFWAFGLEYNTSPGFEIALMYTYYMNTLLGFANTTMDAFMATILYQSQTQLRILRINFQKLPEVCKHLKRNTKEYHDTIMKEFVKCLNHYEKIVKFSSRLDDVFGTAMLIQFGCSGWILGMSAYKMLTINFISIEFLSMILYISCILLELFLYCYYGNEFTIESEQLSQSIYSMEWLDTPAVFQRALVLVMERAKRPLQPVAGRIIPLSLSTFVTILKSSYTFLAVLRQTK